MSAKQIKLSTRNFQYLSGYQFYTLCANKNFVPSMGWPKITSEWRHVRVILMQSDYKNHSTGPSFRFSQIVCTECRKFDLNADLLSRIFKSLKPKNYFTNYHFLNIFLFSKKEQNICYRPIQMIQFCLLRISAWYIKMAELTTFCSCIHTYLPVKYITG